MAALRQIDPHKLMTLLRGELDWVVMKCLEKSRERRYETASALGIGVRTLGMKLKKWREEGELVEAGA